MTVHLHINRLQIEGLPLDAHAVPELERALRLRFAEILAGAGTYRPARHETLESPAITLSWPLTPELLGAQVADSVSTRVMGGASLEPAGGRR
jgi:hypothetical protein